MIFHASSKEHSFLSPQSKFINKEQGITNVIFASHKLYYALPFGLTYNFPTKTGRWSLSYENGFSYIDISEGYVDFDKMCWLYVIDPSDFIQINEFEWISTKKIEYLEKIQYSPMILQRFIR